MSGALIRGARIPGVGVRDVRMCDGIVTEVGLSLPIAGNDVHDLAGYVLLPGLVEPHIHLDKVFSAAPDPGEGAATAQNADGPAGLTDAIRRQESHAREAATSSGTGSHRDVVAARAGRALRRYVASGTTAIRCHVGCGRSIDNESLRAILDVREQWRDVIRVQVVADIGWPQGSPWREHVGRLREALDAGADLVGGYPSLEAEPDEAMEACLAVAREYGRGVDFHLDEVLEPEDQDVRRMARLLLDDPLGASTTASHCVALGSCEPALQREIAREIAAVGISVITNPMTNLYLQDRPAAQMRGLTAIQALIAEGVTVAAGSDNIQDAFNPVGRCDPLEIASLLITAGQCEVDDALDMVTTSARRVMGMPPAGAREGMVADLVAVRATSPTTAIADAPADRVVFVGGRLIASTRVATQFAHDSV